MRKRILVVSPTPSHPQHEGNSARIYQLLIGLKAAGHEVYFAHIEETTGDKASMAQYWGDRFFSIPYAKPPTAYPKHKKHWLAKVLTRLKALIGNDPRYTYAIDDWYDDASSEAIATIAQKIDPNVVIAEYVFFSKILESFDSNVLKIIDTHDIFTQRYKLYQKNNQKPRWFSTTQQEEKKGLCRADIAIAIQAKEAAFFSQLLPPSNRVVTVGHLVPLQPIPLRTSNHSILYIGSRNPINVSGLNHFIQKIFPKVKAQLANAQIVLAGGICDRIEDFEGCQKLGRVDNLEEAYAQANLAINPVYFGTGLKIKSIEALGYAKPLVTTSTGAEGLEAGTGKAFIVANTDTDFAESIVSILTNQQQRETLSKAAYRFAQQRNFQCLQSLADILEAR